MAGRSLTVQQLHILRNPEFVVVRSSELRAIENRNAQLEAALRLGYWEYGDEIVVTKPAADRSL